MKTYFQATKHEYKKKCCVCGKLTKREQWIHIAPGDNLGLVDNCYCEEHEDEMKRTDEALSNFTPEEWKELSSQIRERIKEEDSKIKEFKDSMKILGY